jgi:hypothetical protein
MTRCVSPLLALVAGVPVFALTGALTQSSTTVAVYGTHEVTLSHSVTYANPWEDLVLRARYISPSGETLSVGGFYYQANQWKVRFAPTQPGTWRWTVTADHSGDTLSQSGQFSCVAGSDHGFLRLNAANARRLAYADGSSFYPVGLEDCLGAGGPMTFDSQRRDRNTYLDTFSHAGFNIFRISMGNCAYVVEATGGITAAGNRYDETNSKELDALCQALKQYGFRIVLVMFNNTNTTAYADSSTSTPLMNAVKRYVKYYVDRWGAYVDIWETVNESYAPFGQYAFASWNRLDAILVPYIRQCDPYAHPVGQELYRQASAADRGRFDLCMPHDYLDGTNTDQDSMVLYSNGGFGGYAQSGIRFHESLLPRPMPIVYGEYGNNQTCCWHANSALWHRIRHWVLYFNQAAAISWHQGGSQTYCGPPSNIWLGPTERSYTRIVQRFCADLDPALAPCSLTTVPASVHGYGLRAATSFAVYLYNTGNQSSPLSGVGVTVSAPFAQGQGYWYDPVTGDTLSRVSITSANQQLTAPAFAIDMALKITATGVAVSSVGGRTAGVASSARGLTVTTHGVLLRSVQGERVWMLDLRGRVLASAVRR